MIVKSETKHRSLYNCMEARYPSDGSLFIYCRKGYILSKHGVSILAFQRGAPLIYSACQKCPGFNDADGR